MIIKVDGKEILRLSKTDEFFLDNDLMSIKEWIVNAVIGKINNCEIRFKRGWYPRLEADSKVKQIPANRDELVAMIKKRPDYKNRKQREKEKEKK